MDKCLKDIAETVDAKVYKLKDQYLSRPDIAPYEPPQDKRMKK